MNALFTHEFTMIYVPGKNRTGKFIIQTDDNLEHPMTTVEVGQEPEAYRKAEEKADRIVKCLNHCNNLNL